MSRIVATYDPPPIPVRNCDWSAVLDTYDAGDPIGWGRTRDEAVADLEEQLADQANDYADRIEARCVDLSPDMKRCAEKANG
ncbi:hypothetical protein UFOVP399_4 [uncultured Caudovirales phage]|uniref:Uncharacterized protein n=1 Tax=uncultured Caudovirales phage TaxID=2100421 RepID=A0A6J5M6X0_9CAUD|nr:hypothetical protein UFOVP399_4 [uncultured Caudovirales phage]